MLQFLFVVYVRDIEVLMGCVIYYDDSMERGFYMEFEEGFDSISRLWEDIFGQFYERVGIMYRGVKFVNFFVFLYDGYDG